MAEAGLEPRELSLGVGDREPCGVELCDEPEPDMCRVDELRGLKPRDRLSAKTREGGGRFTSVTELTMAAAALESSSENPADD